jgi:hypothetical protein
MLNLDRPITEADIAAYQAQNGRRCGACSLCCKLCGGRRSPMPSSEGESP